MNAKLEETGLLFACLLDGQGAGRLLDWHGIEQWRAGDGVLWLHMDRTNPDVAHWLRHESGLTDATIDALLVQESRPRTFRGKRGVVTILRGVNLNPGKDPDDMIDLRIWCEGHRVITLREQHLKSARDVLAELTDHGSGPTSAAQLYQRLIVRVTERIAPCIEEIEERMDQLELVEGVTDPSQRRSDLAHLRNEATILRRYLSPQRNALHDLVSEPPTWADESWAPRLRETGDRVTHFLEELDAVRERAMIVKDDIANELAQATNRTMYILAVISGIFLPLSFLTGLMGINIGGMPGVESNRAFWVFSALLAGLAFGQIWLFRKMKWV